MPASRELVRVGRGSSLLTGAAFFREAGVLGLPTGFGAIFAAAEERSLTIA